jgi:hypothetical protein
LQRAAALVTGEQIRWHLQRGLVGRRKTKMIRNAALLAVMLLAAPVVANADAPNPMATPIPAPKIDIPVNAVPGTHLGTPKPTACGAQSTDFLLSSCSGAPGAKLTLTLAPGNAITPVAILFAQSVPSKASYTARVGLSAGAYTLTVPPLCNSGNPSFGLGFTFERGNTHFSQGLGTFTAICGQTAQATSAPQVISCGGTTNPLTADKCSKSASNSTPSGFSATCGASITITGTTFPAGSSDWLEFVVPASHMTCKTVSVYISSSGGILFSVYQSPAAGTLAACGDGNCAGTVAGGVPQYAGLGTGTTGLPPGSYYIKIYGTTPSTVGTWTLKISS